MQKCMYLSNACNWYAKTPCENWDIFLGQNNDHMNIKSDYDWWST